MPSDPALDAIETASRDEIVALQTERLRWSLRHAYENIKHIRAKFDSADVKPGDFKELADLARFPFTTKQDLRDTYPFGMFAVPENKVVRIHASSGTTGKPTVVGYTQKDIDTWAQLMARSIHAAADRALEAAHRQDYRPLRRHADHPRRQRLPESDRGADPQDRQAGPALPADGFPPETSGRPDRARRDETRTRRRQRPARDRGGELRHHIKALIGINTRIEVMDTGGVERSAGKAKRIVDLRQA